MSEWFNPIALRMSKLHRVLAVLSAIGLMSHQHICNKEMGPLFKSDPKNFEIRGPNLVPIGLVA